MHLHCLSNTQLDAIVGENSAQGPAAREDYLPSVRRKAVRIDDDGAELSNPPICT